MLFGNNSREDYVVLNYLHSRIMMYASGPWGQRDVQLTRAAVARPYQTAFGQEVYGNKYQKAAALLDAIVNRIVFQDGNKRTALAAALIYLRRNQCVLTFNRSEGETFMQYVVTKHPPVDEIAGWLQFHTVGRQLSC